MKIATIFILIIFVFAGQGVRGQGASDKGVELWTLQKCIEYAVENNIDIRQRVLEMQDREVALNTSRNSRLPDLSANVGQNFYFGRGPGRDGTYRDQTQSSSSFSVGTNVPLFSGLRIKNQIKVNELNLEAAMEDLNRAKEDLSLNITSYFLQVLFNKELLIIANEQILLSQQQVESAEILFKGGKAPESELYEAKASLAREEVNRTEAANALTLSLLDLVQLLNLESLEKFDVAMNGTDELPVNESVKLLSPENVYEESVNNRPSIKAAELRLQSSENYMKVSKADYYPRLSLNASYSNAYYHTYNLKDGAKNMSFSDQLDNNGSEVVGLSLSIPIFSRMAVRNQVKSAKLSIENQQLFLNDMKQNLYKEIQQAYYNAVAAHDKYSASEQAVEASRIAFEYEEQKYKAGRSTIYQFDEAKNRLAKSQAELVQSKYTFIFRTKILNFYRGTPLY